MHTITQQQRVAVAELCRKSESSKSSQSGVLCMYVQLRISHIRLVLSFTSHTLLATCASNA
jgi:hypothetical protein